MGNSKINTIDSSNWVDLYADQLYNFTYSRTHNSALSEDLVQETLRKHSKQTQS